MNSITQRVIEFLSHPELPFGGEEDVLLLADPPALWPRVAGLLDEFPLVLGADETQNLKNQLGQADWNAVAQAFAARVEAASGFFGVDAENA
jgi:hypothetical protein